MDMPPELTQILLDCLHADPARLDARRLAALRGEEWRALLDLARAHGVSSTLYYLLKIRGLENIIPPEQAVSLRDSYLGNSVHNLVLKNDLAQVAGALRSRGIPLLVLKGAYLAECVYPDPAMRRMADIDLLVPAGRLEETAGVLETLGFRAKRPYRLDQEISVLHHLPGYRNASGTYIELHWTLIGIMDNAPVDPAPLRERAQPAAIGGAAVLGLCPEDLLLHVCGHAAYHHEFQMGLHELYDILTILQRFQSSLRWELLAQTAAQWRWQRGVYLLLRMAAELLGAPLPEGFLSNLRPQGFDETLYNTACAQMVLRAYHDRSVPTSLARWHVAGLPGKMRIAWQRVFLPRNALAIQYRVKPTGPMIYYYYLRRLVDLMKSYLGTAYHLRRGNTPTASFAERRGRLLEWLHEQ